MKITDTQKNKYREFCQQEPSVPLFSQAWWMDAVCGEDGWDVIVIEKDQQVVATLPYSIRHKLGCRFVTQPLLTQTNGPWISRPASDKTTTIVSHEIKLLSELTEHLNTKKFTYFNQHFHHSISNWLPFYWAGYRQSTRYTYVIEKLDDLTAVYGSFTDVRRNDIRKAEKAVKVIETEDVGLLHDLVSKTFERQHLRMPYSLNLLQIIDQACREHACRKIFLAHDAEGNLHAAVYIVWDANTAYYLLGGADPTYRNSQATSLLLWNAIRFASQVSKSFDFEGSMIKNVEMFCRSFGTVQKPYHNVYKGNLFLIIADEIIRKYPKLKFNSLLLMLLFRKK